MASQCWIFQANPAIYRMREAVAQLPSLHWSVKQHRDGVKLGDTVYLWESGPNGGLVGRTSVIAPVGVYPEPPEETAFWVSPPTDSSTPSVLLRIDEVYPPSVSVKREDLLRDSVLNGMRLLKMPQGTNYPLTNEEAAALERMIGKRPSFPEVLKLYCDEGVVFNSIERGALYCVRTVDDGGAEIARLSAQKPERVTWTLHEQRLEDLRSNNGRQPISVLSNTITIRVTLLQSPLMGLSPGRDQILTLDDEADAVNLLCELIARLNVDRSQGEPKLYKPVMLAALIEAVGAGEISDHRILFDVLLPRFLAKLEQLGRPAGVEQAALAFYHLTGDLFWNLAYLDVERRVEADNVSPKSIRERVRYAVLKEPFRWIMRKESHRRRLLEKLAEIWWPSKEVSMTQRRYWWVNQGASFEKEHAHGTIWCPQVDKSGSSPHHWVNVSRVRRGDLIFHCAKGEIRSISIAAADAAEGNKPREIAIDDEWQVPGWFATVAYHDLNNPIIHKELREAVRRLDIPGGPFNKHGAVNQGYLFPLNDRAVCLIAGQLTETQLSPDVIAALAESNKRVWDAFLHWGKKFLAHGSIRLEERTEKLAGSQGISAVRTKFKSGDTAWLEDMKRALGKSNWATDYRTRDNLLTWWNNHPDAASKSVASIWDRNSDIATCIVAFWRQIPADVVSGNGIQASVASFIFGEREPERFPLYRSEPYQDAYALTGSWRKTLTAAETYVWGLEFLDRIITEATARGVELSDRLDAQTLLWCVVKRVPPEEWSAEERQALSDYRAGKVAVHDESVSEDVDPVTALAEKLLIPREFIEETHRLLQSKGQVVFYGPPGTGKTFVARELARHFAGGADNVEIVQFHPSYSYEDFVEGFRPRRQGDQVGFELIRGPLRRLARRAAKDPAGKYVLLIDEINRGNIAKVFGELYFLLEYRNEKIRLQYDHRRQFSLPENLWIIGTMNTADRSIALMDAALRRRFFFLPFFPDEPPIAGLLQRWLERHRPAMKWVADVVERANKLLGDRHGAIGPSHFMRLDLDDSWLPLIWKHAVMPYLAEHFFGEEDRLKSFELEVLKAAGASPASPQS